MNSTKTYTEEIIYDGLGTYLGIITVYRYKKDYVERVHKFALKDPKGDGRSCAKVTEILIERIPRTDV